ncbi:MAG: DEAD/DEAH box helicase family protein, partial [Candidatus Bathyarchaeia archaeon]
SFDLQSFSKNKKLWDYQQEALKNAIKVLWKYYEDFSNYEKNEQIDENQKRKAEFYRWYKDNGLEEDPSINLDKRKRDIYNLLTEYYPQENGKISYEHLINRMCFWMATGSGKTLVIVKLIQILKGLIEREEIPPFDILILTHRDDLIQQLKRHVTEFNYGGNGIRINLKELREYPEAKRQQPLIKENEITIFYYRSDNLSDEQKEKIVDFRNYDDNGKWYIFLDEAHKGDKEESKRQHIYSILSRNGFLFNFSATFIDPRDLITTAFNFNLERFINSGYGKHISILKQEIRAFRDKEEDYSGDEKQKIVLKSLILLTYSKKFREQIINTNSEMYHNPLLLTLVNSVNTEDADLKLFFRELERIGNGDIEDENFTTALNELWQELKNEPDYTFEEGNALKIDEAVFKGITKEDILKYAYNSERSGQTEILIRPSDRKEMAFKLKTSDRPFALIKIGDISGWLKDEFVGYEVQERFEDESYFQNLNREDSEINILMGSRTFYEGWDSNRPNVINYVNIGTGEDARKFILQSVGRGIRIEPVKNKRKRLLPLYNAKEIQPDLFNKVRDKVQPLETLCIFGTNRNALDKVIKELELQKGKEGEFQISLSLNEATQNCTLLIPAYKDAEYPLLKEGKQIKFELSEKDFEALAKFIEYIDDDRILLMKYNTEPAKTQLLRERLKDHTNFKLSQKGFKNIDILTQRIFDYFGVLPKQFDNLHELKEEIKHFSKIKVYLKDVSELQTKIETVRNYPKNERDAQEQYGKITPSEYMELVKKLKKEEAFEANRKKIKIRYVANHYYVPLILSDDEKIDYIRHIIKHKSEVKFINDLENYLAKNNNKFKEFDWWLFCKLDETLDEVYIPYYNPNGNKISNFYPDFIFWLKKGNEYQIIFVDPKGIQHIDWTYKIEGYKWLFEENNNEKTFDYNGFKVKVKLLLRTDDVASISGEYQKYWFDHIEKILS